MRDLSAIFRSLDAFNWTVPHKRDSSAKYTGAELEKDGKASDIRGSISTCRCP